MGVGDTGVSLLPEILRLELGEAVRWPEPKIISEGIPEWSKEGWNMVNLYNTFDALMLCLTGDDTIFCNPEPKLMLDVKIGDKVLTHTGNFKEVTHKFSRFYDGPIYNITPLYGMPTKLTPEHPVLAVKTKKCRSGTCRICKSDCAVLRRGKKAAISKDPEAVKEYHQVMKLRKETNWGYRRIAKFTGINKHKVSSWLYTNSKPLGLHSIYYCTTRHYEDYKLEWIPAKELKEWDYVVIPRPKQIVDTKTIKISDYVDNIIVKDGLVYKEGRNQFGAKFIHPQTKTLEDKIRITPNLLFLFGLYIAEGSSERDGICFSIASYEKDLTTEIRKAIKNCFKFDVKIKDATRHRRKVITYSVVLEKLFRELFGRNARKKKIPKWILELPEPKIWHFIRGMWLGDGYETVAKKKMFSYTTTSYALAHQLWMLLARLGFITSIKYQKKKKAYRIRVSGIQLKEFVKKIMMPTPIHRNRHSYNFGYVDENLIYMPISKIEKIKHRGLVYNLAVKEDQSYTSYFNIHNCSGGEGAGLPLLEAAACGVPGLTTDYAAGPEYVGPGYTIPWKDYVIYDTPGVRRPLADVDEMARVLTKIMNSDPEKLAKKSMRFAENFRWRKIIEMFWKPFLRKCEEELYPLVTKEGVSSWA